jgi:hypothetical protein
MLEYKCCSFDCSYLLSKLTLIDNHVKDMCSVMGYISMIRKKAWIMHVIFGS